MARFNQLRSSLRGQVSGLAIAAALAPTIGYAGGAWAQPATQPAAASGGTLEEVVVTARRVRFPVLLVGLAVQQVLLHVVFDAAAASAGCSPVAVVHHAVVQLACAPGHGMGSMGYGWSMLAGHALATLLTACLLARGEAWWWRAADRVVRAAGSAARLPRAPRRARPIRTRRRWSISAGGSSTLGIRTTRREI